MRPANQYHRKVAGWLDQLGVAYTEEFQVRATSADGNRHTYFLDLYLPELSRAVEIDGPMHSLRRRRDAERDAALAARGINTVRIRVGTRKKICLEAMLAD